MWYKTDLASATLNVHHHLKPMLRPLLKKSSSLRYNFNSLCISPRFRIGSIFPQAIQFEILLIL